MDYTIAEMKIQDLQEIKNCLDTEYDNFWSYQTLESEINSESSIYILIKNNQNLILGFTGIKVILDEAELMNIVVKKDFRNCGIGAILLKNIIKKARELEIKKIYLEVNDTNLPAINLYKKFNFKQIGIRKKYYGNNNGILMDLSLEQKRTLITSALFKTF